MTRDTKRLDGAIVPERAIVMSRSAARWLLPVVVLSILRLCRVSGQTLAALHRRRPLAVVCPITACNIPIMAFLSWR